MSSSFLLEGAYQLTTRDHLYARTERVDRDLELLETKQLAPEEEVAEQHIDAIHALTAGYLRELRLFGDRGPFKDVHAGLGADLTVYAFPSRLEPAYGENPISFRVFLRARWGRPHGGAGHGMH